MSSDMFPDPLVKYLLENPMPEKIHYHHYHISGVTDEAVIRKEAEYRFTHGGWISVVHQHGILGKCEGKCQIIAPHEHTDSCARGCDFVSTWAPWSEEDYHD